MRFYRKKDQCYFCFGESNSANQCVSGGQDIQLDIAALYSIGFTLSQICKAASLKELVLNIPNLP